MLIINISPPKCGTTSLYFCLTRCADVAAPKIKEPRFFASRTIDHNIDLPEALQPAGHFEAGQHWFDNLFDANNPKSHRIDFTTYYAITPETPNLLAQTAADTNEDVKLIMVMRDPIDRFVSHYYQYEKMGVDLPSIAQLIADDSDLSRFMLSFADYQDTIARYSAQFGTDQILLLDFAAMVDDPAGIETQVLDFLGLADFKFQPTTSEKNVAGRPRNRLIQKLIFSNSTKKISNLIPASIKPYLLQFRKKVVRANTVAQAYPALDDASLAMLQERLAAATAFYSDTFSKP